MIPSQIVACHSFGLTEVSKDPALNKTDFRVVWRAFLLTKRVLLLSISLSERLLGPGALHRLFCESRFPHLSIQVLGFHVCIN